MKKVKCIDNFMWNGTIGKEYEIIGCKSSVYNDVKITQYTVIDDNNELDVIPRYFFDCHINKEEVELINNLKKERDRVTLEYEEAKRENIRVKQLNDNLPEDDDEDI